MARHVDTMHTMPTAEYDHYLGAWHTRWRKYVDAYPHYVAVNAIAHHFLTIPVSSACARA